MDVGARIKELRNSKNMSQNDLALLLGISKSSINMYERGEREPGLANMCMLADCFGVTVDFLCGRESDVMQKNTPQEEPWYIRLTAAVKAWVQGFSAQQSSIGDIFIGITMAFGLSIPQLQKDLGYSRNQVLRLCTNKKHIFTEDFKKLEKLYAVPYDVWAGKLSFLSYYTELLQNRENAGIAEKIGNLNEDNRKLVIHLIEKLSIVSE